MVNIFKYDYSFFPRLVAILLLIHIYNIRKIRVIILLLYVREHVTLLCALKIFTSERITLKYNLSVTVRKTIFQSIYCF